MHINNIAVVGHNLICNSILLQHLHRLQPKTGSLEFVKMENPPFAIFLNDVPTNTEVSMKNSSGNYVLYVKIRQDAPLILLYL